MKNHDFLYRFTQKSIYIDYGSNPQVIRSARNFNPAMSCRQGLIYLFRIQNDSSRAMSSTRIEKGSSTHLAIDGILLNDHHMNTSNIFQQSPTYTKIKNSQSQLSQLQGAHRAPWHGHFFTHRPPPLWAVPPVEQSAEPPPEIGQSDHTDLADVACGTGCVISHGVCNIP